jgi:hypothetical protein
MYPLFIAAALSLVSAPGSALPAGPSGLGAEPRAGLEAVHCTPGKNHHFPTWNYQRDGCRRGPRKNARAKKPKT